MLLGRKKQAYYYFKKSNRINPVDNLVTWNLAWCSLALGHLDMGFKLFEKRWDIVEGHKKRFVNIHEINNLEHIINKKVLVWDEFGLGDVIQFSRFVIDLLTIYFLFFHTFLLAFFSSFFLKFSSCVF